MNIFLFDYRDLIYIKHYFHLDILQLSPYEKNDDNEKEKDKEDD